MGPNGIGLSSDGGTLYVAETPAGRLWAWDVTGVQPLAGSARAQSWNTSAMAL